MSNVDEKINIIKNNIKSYPDFPKPGIIFRDTFSIFQKPDVLKIANELLINYCKKLIPFDCIVALDARGFLFGPLIALELNVPFVPIRKKGKLPGNVVQEIYTLEYGNDIIEIQKDSIKCCQNILIIDDLLATGGTLKAACNLLKKLDVQVAGCVVLMELIDLNGRKNIPCDVLSIIQYKK